MTAPLTAKEIGYRALMFGDGARGSAVQIYQAVRIESLNPITGEITPQADIPMTLTAARERRGAPFVETWLVGEEEFDNRDSALAELNRVLAEAEAEAQP